MIFRIAGGIGLLLLAASMLGLAYISDQVTAIFLLIGAIGLLAGL